MAVCNFQEGKIEFGGGGGGNFPSPLLPPVDVPTNQSQPE